jgi:hypothetical protein
MEQAAGFLLLLLAAVVALQLFQGGPEQLKAWRKAKFGV